MNEKLRDIINNIIKEITHKVSYINCGGCGWFSYFLSRELFNLGIYYKVVVIGCTKGSRKLIDTLRMEEQYIPKKDWLSARHYMIKINDYYIDGYYIGKKVPEKHEDYPKSSSFIYPQNILKACQYGDWNDQFDTFDIDVIEEIIVRNFKNY